MPFIFFSHLILLAKTNIVLNSSGESGHPFLFQLPLICVRKILWIPSCWVFYHVCMLDFVKCVSEAVYMTMWLLNGKPTWSLLMRDEEGGYFFCDAFGRFCYYGCGGLIKSAHSVLSSLFMEEIMSLTLHCNIFLGILNLKWFKFMKSVEKKNKILQKNWKVIKLYK